MKISHTIHSPDAFTAPFYAGNLGRGELPNLTNITFRLAFAAYTKDFGMHVTIAMFKKLPYPKRALYSQRVSTAAYALYSSDARWFGSGGGKKK